MDNPQEKILYTGLLFTSLLRLQIGDLHDACVIWIYPQRLDVKKHIKNYNQNVFKIKSIIARKSLIVFAKNVYDRFSKQNLLYK